MKVELREPIEGYEAEAEYRRPKRGELFIDSSGMVSLAEVSMINPWLVLKPIEPQAVEYTLPAEETIKLVEGPIYDYVDIGGCLTNLTDFCRSRGINPDKLRKPLRDGIEEVRLVRRES